MKTIESERTEVQAYLYEWERLMLMCPYGKCDKGTLNNDYYNYCPNEKDGANVD
jgi:hypothetical protein